MPAPREIIPKTVAIYISSIVGSHVLAASAVGGDFLEGFIAHYPQIFCLTLNSFKTYSRLGSHPPIARRAAQMAKKLSLGGGCGRSRRGEHQARVG